jgi:hypothetical protein
VREGRLRHYLIGSNDPSAGRRNERFLVPLGEELKFWEWVCACDGDGYPFSKANVVH